MNNINKIQEAFTIGLLAYDGKFSYSKGCEVFTNISSYQLKRFLDKDWDENHKLEDYIKSLNIDWSTGWLMVDDTIIEKPYAEKIECVYWQYSSKNKSFIEGISLTILAWSDGKKTIPIKFMVYEKDSQGKALQTKNGFAEEAIEYAKNLGISPKYVCFDSKFSSKSMLNKLNSFNWIYFSQLSSNRVFNGQQLKMRRFQPYSEEGNLKGVGHKVNITKYCKRYYVTNSTGKSITSKYIVKHYRVRWDIEVLFRNLKQLCHLQDCQSKKTQAQRHYVFMCIRAFLTLQNQNQKSVYQAKKHFQQKNLRIKINGNKALRQVAA
jgi:putative transposase